jgi:hypothetical protein
LIYGINEPTGGKITRRSPQRLRAPVDAVCEGGKTRRRYRGMIRANLRFDANGEADMKDGSALPELAIPLVRRPNMK